MAGEHKGQVPLPGNAIEYLSYSALKLFETDPEMYYRRYLCKTNKLPRDPQNHYMALGSAFDAYIKADLHEKFINDGDPRFKRDTIFEMQVEPQCRDLARVDGEIVLERYKKSGAYDNLLKEMKGCMNPNFEVEVRGEVLGAMLMGKPDIMYISRTGLRVVHDFKVNGYYSKAPKSPEIGYLVLFPAKTMHSKCMPVYHREFMINANCPMHLYCEDWAQQLSMYAWMMGEPIGGDYVLTIDQIACDSVKKTQKIAHFSARCTESWQKMYSAKIVEAWKAINSKHIFRQLSFEMSQGRCEAIDNEMKTVLTDKQQQSLGAKRER